MSSILMVPWYESKRSKTNSPVDEGTNQTQSILRSNFTHETLCEHVRTFRSWASRSDAQFVVLHDWFGSRKKQLTGLVEVTMRVGISEIFKTRSSRRFIRSTVVGTYYLSDKSIPSPMFNIINLYPLMCNVLVMSNAQRSSFRCSL